MTFLGYIIFSYISKRLNMLRFLILSILLNNRRQWSISLTQIKKDVKNKKTFGVSTLENFMRKSRGNLVEYMKYELKKSSK